MTRLVSRVRRVHSPRRTAALLRLEQLEERSLLSYGFTALDFLDTPAPGPGNLSHTFDFEPGRINNRGQIAYGSDLTDTPGDDIGEGVFLRQPNGQEVALARVGDPTPDGTTYAASFLGEITLNNRGNGVFSFLRTPADPDITGVNGGLYRFSGPNHQVTAAALPGTPAPGGGTFQGFGFRPSINDSDKVAFTGIIPATIGPGAPAGLGQGIFTVDTRGRIAAVVRPGDRAPGHQTFDWAQNGWINNEGDVAFGGHVMEDPCIQFGVTFPETLHTIFCAESVYFWNHRTGRFESIAHQGGPAPGGETFSYAFGPVLNDAGDIAFSGALPAFPAGTGIDPMNNDNNVGIYLHRHGRNIVVAEPPTPSHPGTALPGGGHLVSASFFTLGLGFNNEGVISFNAKLDTSTFGIADTGLYTWSHGVLSLVARTGTVIPGLGTIKSLYSPDEQGSLSTPVGGAAINDRGQIVFQATLTDGRGVLLLATPGREHGGYGYGDDDHGGGGGAASAAPGASAVNPEDASALAAALAGAAQGKAPVNSGIVPYLTQNHSDSVRPTSVAQTESGRDPAAIDAVFVARHPSHDLDQVTQSTDPLKLSLDLDS